MNVDTAARLGIRVNRRPVGLREEAPGELNVGSGGNGSAGHLAAEMFKSQAGVYLVHPYAGGGPAQLALIAGRVELNFDNLAAASANIKAGKLKAIAVTTAQRSSALPDVPTIAERRPGAGRLRRRHLVRPVRARRHGARADATPEPRLRRRAGDARAQGAPGRPARRGLTDHAEEQFAAFVASGVAQVRARGQASGEARLTASALR